MKVIKLDVNEDHDLEGIDAVALVENPAIEIDFHSFSEHKFQSFNDYPKAARKAAEQGIKRNKELGNKCGTLVGKQRAQQLAKGENVTIDTIKRMRSFLLRQKDNYDLAIRRKDYEACGYISYLLWGGPSALPWAEKKLRQAGLLEASNEEIIRAEMSKFVKNAGGFSVGDYVSWTFAGRGKDADRGRGQIKDIRIQGVVKIPGSNFEFKPTEDRPLALIETRGGKIVGQYTDNLRKIQKPDGFADIRMIEGIPVFDNPEAALELAKKIGCEGSHEHEIEGSIVYMPCERHSEATDLILKQDKYISDLSEEKQTQILDALNNVGLNKKDLEADGWVEMSEDSFHNHLYFAITTQPEPNKGSLQDTSLYRILYSYEGPLKSTSRRFCRDMISLTKKGILWRLEDINNLSLNGENQEFGTYDIFRYKGSYNCSHRWVQKFYTKRKDVEDQKRSLVTNKDYQEVTGGPRTQEAAQVNPKSRTLQQILDGVPEGEFKFSKEVIEQQLLVTPIMIADKLIPRIDDEGNKYYVFFDADGIKKLSYKLMKNKLVDSINIEHDPNRKVNDINLVETWLVEDPETDKSRLYGFNVKKGSWMGIYKVDNKDVWNNYIKTGRVKGVSVEGIFSDKIISNFEKN